MPSTNGYGGFNPSFHLSYADDVVRGYRNPLNLISIAYLIAAKRDFATAPAQIPSPT